MSSEDAIAMIAALNERITELETANATLSADKDKAVTELATTKTQLSEKTAEVLKLKKLPVTTSVTEQFGKEKEKVDDAPKSGSREYFKSLIAKQQAN
jgi:predicted nuclease with TOPRIM domain